MSVFFISDTHFGHRNICKYRSQFNSPKEHDEYIIQNWNNKVKKGKYIVYILGDVCIKNKYYDFDSLLNRLRGNIRIMLGNHDDIHYFKTSKLLNKKFTIWNGIFKKYGYWISHAPIHPDELRGHKNIHGHTHNHNINDSRYLNVSVENINYSPISLDEIKQIFPIGGE